MDAEKWLWYSLPWFNEELSRDNSILPSMAAAAGDYHCTRFSRFFLSGSDRDQQGIPTKFRLEILQEWYDYLKVPSQYQGVLQIGGGLSLSSGAVSFHQDHLQDPSRQYDQIAWGGRFIDSWANYLSLKNLEKLKSMGVATENTMFTSLVYSRSITGSQAAKLEGVVNQTCPLFKCCVSLINDEQFPFDYNYLEDTSRRNYLIGTLENMLEDERKKDFHYKGQYVFLNEGNNRYTFLGSFANVWFKFLEVYRGHVRVRHCFEYLSFVMRECNGSALLVETMQQILIPGINDEVKNMLDEPVPSLYIFMSQKMRHVYGRTNGLICLDAPRWQMIDHPLWSCAKDDEKTRLYVDFVIRTMWVIATGSKAEQIRSRQMICSSQQRIKSKSLSKLALESIRIGPVRGTFGIQLSAFILGTPASNAHYATIEKGKSGFYKCVNLHVKQKTGSTINIPTNIANDEVDACVAGLVKMGFPVHHAWIDQNCCYWHRKYGRDDGTSGLKKDVFFFDEYRQLFILMRVKSQKAGQLAVQFFVKDMRYNLTDYWQPLFDMNDLQSIIKRCCNTRHPDQLSTWVKEMRGRVSIDEMRRKLCRKPDGSYSML